ncbi:hypothetical protein [Leifsonia aquatica]|uniref:hypothetical protein n=1 Tax=Leifsonia aquatica TaxID=144185 RepID=UPI0004A7F696|nr:hypothetical protein [Leifsonia aquatica]
MVRSLRAGLLGLVALLALAGCSASGPSEIVAPLSAARSHDDSARPPDLTDAVLLGHSPLGQLATGTCTDYLTGGSLTSEGVALLDCDHAHVSQVFATPDLGGGRFPGEDRVHTLSDGACMEAFSAAVGTSYDDSDYGYFWIRVKADDWTESGPNRIRCILFDTNLDPLSGSALLPSAGDASPGE